MNVQKLAALALTSLLALPAMAQTTTAPGATRSSPTSAPSHAATTTPPATSHTATSSASSSTASTKPGAAQDKLVDINSASASELDALPGIGKARSSAIIKNRPYKGKDDLASKHIIPQNVYDGIKDKIVARQG